MNQVNEDKNSGGVADESPRPALETCAHPTVLLYVTHGRFAPVQRYWSCQECGASFSPTLNTPESGDDYAPCPDPRCNDHLGVLPIPQCVTAVAWAEKVIELETIAEAGRDFVWEPENWEAYTESKDSNSAAWPPEFLLLAQAVEKKYGAMPIDAPERDAEITNVR